MRLLQRHGLEKTWILYENMRYRGIKGKFWQVFSEFIRRRDTKRFGGKCIACRRIRKLQAGHFAPASNCGFSLLFDERNVNGECAYCNSFDSGHLIPYRSGLVERYGEAWVVQLETEYNASRYKGKITKEWPKAIYQAKIEEYKEKINNL